jgi:PAS domain S-box-containing protein
MADASGTVVEFNPAAERTFGYSRDEAVGRTIAELIVPPSLRERHIAAFARFVETSDRSLLGRRLELTGMRADGSEFPVELALTRLEGEPVLICGALRDISAARQAENHLRELGEEQAALRRVATLVARESSPQQLFAIVAEQVARIVDVPLVRLVRYELDGSAAELVGGWGESVDPLAVGTRWQLDGPGVLASVWETGRPARLDHYTDLQGPAAAVVRQAGMRSAVASPINVEGRLWGAIAVLSPRREPLPERTEARLAAFTELVATAIANAEARRELERFAAEQHALREAATFVASGASLGEVFAAITTSASELFEVPFASLLRYGADEQATMVAGCAACSGFVGQTWTVPDDDPGIVRTVVDSRRPARIEDHSGVHGPLGEAASALGIGSVVGAPVIVDGSVWGVLAVGAARDGPPLPTNAGDRLHGFTGLVTTTLINAEARDRVRSLLDEQETLRRVATLIAQGADPDAFFAAVCNEAVELFEAEQAAVVRLEIDEPALVTVGVSAGLQGVTIGMRSALGGWPTSSAACRTGHTARTDVAAAETTGTGTIADLVRARGFLSTISAPIVVDGSMWGAMTVSDSRRPLASDTERRIENFTELIATAIANREAREALTASEARARELASEQAALRRVAVLAARESAAVEVLEAVAEEAARVLEVDAIGMIRFEPDEVGTLVAQSETPWDPPPLGTRFTLEGANVVASVHGTGRVARMDDWERATGSVAAMASVLGVRSAVASPIVVEGRLWGTMIAATNRSKPLPADTELRIVEFTELLATAISNAESREALMQLVDEQAALRRVATLVAAGVEPDELFAAVSDEVAQLFAADGAGVGRYEPKGSGLVSVGTSERLRSSVPLGSRQDLDKSLIAGEVYRTGGAARFDMRHDDVGETGALGEMALRVLDLGFCSIVGAPIVVEGELWGLMTASSSHTTLPPNTEKRVESFAELIATAIANAETRKALMRLADEQAALRRVATLVAAGTEPDQLFSAVSEEVAQLFGADSAAVGRFEADGSGVVVVGRSKGLRGIPVGTHADLDESPTFAGVHGTRRAARWSDKFYSSVAAPIMVEGSLWGVITAGSGREGLPSDTEARLEKFGELVATAIANAESRAELAASDARARELASEQAALRRVATLVARGASADELFSAVADEVAGIIDIPVVGVGRYEADGTFTMLGVAGETNLTVGSRWPVEQEGIAEMILATGRPSRRDDDATMPARLGEAVGEHVMVVSTLGVPIVVEGTIWGFMVAAARPGRSIPADTEARLARFTALVATAVSNATARTDLLTSRARLVSTADETRRRLERDLHDGIQQWLVALALKARKAAGLSAAGESPVEELSELADDLVGVTDELREISRGIHPAILSDAGLDDALAALARRSAIQVDLDVSFQERFDLTLEATVYYVVAESITNAIKHAQASTVAVRGGLRGESIELEIRDDGVGGADPARGTGLIGLRDRIDTLGGTISLASRAGAGTTIRARLPSTPRNGEQPPRERSNEAASASTSG